MKENSKAVVENVKSAGVGESARASTGGKRRGREAARVGKPIEAEEAVAASVLEAQLPQPM